MNTLISPDGTPIAYARSGAGPPLILVHGTGTVGARWSSVVPALSERHSVYVVERRGRGESGDSDNYALQREFEDIAALVDAAGEPANLLGHSFGALCALEAALLTRNLRALILYEPAIPAPGAELYPDDIMDRLQALLDAGDREAVVTEFYAELVQLPPQDIERLKASPVWPARVAAAHTILRESRAEETYAFDKQRFKDLQTPTLLLTGSDSPSFMKEATEKVHEALPNSQLATLAGQQHLAMDTAPELFLGEVVGFLDSIRN